MSKKKISIIGIKGIPAKYGGFETLVEYLTLELGTKYDISVYCSKSLIDRKEKKYHNQARLVYLPIKANGPQSIFYDFVSIVHGSFFSDTLLVLGVSGAIVFPILKKLSKKRIIINIDGIEHKRAKWKWLARKYLKYAEKLSIKYADIIVADNVGIDEYLQVTYSKSAELIAYGGNHATYEEIRTETTKKYLLPEKYAFKVCRIEPENNIELILKAFIEFKKYPLVLVGNWKSSEYGKRVFNEYHTKDNLTLLDPIYNQKELNQVRCNSYVYIHGHSAGGTNPSLVEAMYLKLPVIAFDVLFNRYTTQDKAMFFNTKSDLVNVLNNLTKSSRTKISNELFEVASRNYTWKKISRQYDQLLS